MRLNILPPPSFLPPSSFLLLPPPYLITRYFQQKSILFQPSVYHALIVIFLEFFSWGLLTNTVVKVSPNLWYLLCYCYNHVVIYMIYTTYIFSLPPSLPLSLSLSLSLSPSLSHSLFLSPSLSLYITVFNMHSIYRFSAIHFLDSNSS